MSAMSQQETMTSQQAEDAIFDVGLLYEQYLAVTQPTLIRPMVDSPDYVHRRATNIPPLGLTLTPVTR